MDIVVSFYKFKSLSDLPRLKQDIYSLASSENLRGTVLLANEGINSSIAGEEAAVRRFLDALQSDPRIGKFLEEKANPADIETHRRLLVKIKKEIVTMHKDNVKHEDTGFYITPSEFKEWCDEGKEMILVDTRNDYEVALGKFHNALDPNIKTFGEFPKWLEDNLSKKKDATIVTYCTGGIRCEKATAYMREEGYSNVYQIKGGILQYFVDLQKEGKAPHWDGECVVFDKRMAVGPDLERTKKELCFNCFAELTSYNRIEELFPAGYLCKTCHGNYLIKRQERQERGLALQEEFRKKRAAYCHEVRQRWEKPQEPHNAD